MDQLGYCKNERGSLIWTKELFSPATREEGKDINYHFYLMTWYQMALDNIQDFDEVIIPRGMGTTFGESRIIFSTNCSRLNLPSFQE